MKSNNLGTKYFPENNLSNNKSPCPLIFLFFSNFRNITSQDNCPNNVHKKSKIGYYISMILKFEKGAYV